MSIQDFNSSLNKGSQKDYKESEFWGTEIPSNNSLNLNKEKQDYRTKVNESINIKKEMHDDNLTNNPNRQLYSKDGKFMGLKDLAKSNKKDNLYKVILEKNKNKIRESNNELKEELLKRAKERQEKRIEKLKKMNEDLTAQEEKECTFQPKINKKFQMYQKPYHNKYIKDTLKNNNEENNKSLDNAQSFYEKNMTWYNNINLISNRKRQIKEIMEMDFSFNPKLNDKKKLNNVFSNNNTQYWYKNNHTYIERRQKCAKEQEEINEMLKTCYMIKLKDVNPIKKITPAVSYFKTINVQNLKKLNRTCNNFDKGFKSFTAKKKEKDSQPNFCGITPIKTLGGRNNTTRLFKKNYSKTLHNELQKTGNEDEEEKKNFKEYAINENMLDNNIDEGAEDNYNETNEENDKNINHNEEENNNEYNEEQNEEIEENENQD